MANNQQMLSWTYQKVTKIVDELIPDIPEEILDKSYIRRDGKLTTVKQELADVKTLEIENGKKLDQILALLKEQP